MKVRHLKRRTSPTTWKRYRKAHRSESFMNSWTNFMMYGLYRRPYAVVRVCSI